MKQFYITLITFLAFTFTASAQAIIYHENFTGITMAAGSAWIVENTNPSTVAQSSKGNYIRTAYTAASEKTVSTTISTLGYSKANITWEQFRNQYKSNFPLTEVVELQYSVNGGVTRTTFYITRNTVNGSWNKANSGTAIALPEAAMGMPEVKLYWKINFTNKNNEFAYYAIDDITIVGTPETGISTFDWSTRPLDENPFTVSGINSATPYTVDDVTMRWSAALNAGVTHEIAKVDDKNFKAGTKSLTLVQLNASGTNGSTIQLDLNKPVEDLTFTIFDVDFAADQFVDKLSIVGYNNGNVVALVKNKVKTTSYNQLSTSPTVALTGLINNDNASGEGDVMITFSKPVTKVVIQYNNASTATTKIGNGRQGISIHNLTWRKDQQITVLPVELASFKAIRKNSASILDWSTASEKNNEKFEIERSQDGKSFSKIGEVAGNGTSNKKLAYTYSDSKPATGINYYRLRQVDFDGTVSFSKIVSVSFVAKAGEPLAQVFPTMATDNVTIALTQPDKHTSIVIVDATGKMITQYAQFTDRELLVPVQNLKTGVYLVTVNNGTMRETYRFLKQ